MKIKTLPIEIISVYRLFEKTANDSPSFSHCIAITDPGEIIDPAMYQQFQEVLHLEFHDIVKKSDLPIEDHPCTPKMAHVDKLIKFLSKTSDYATGYTIHCHAGVHRSVAAGLIALYSMFNSEESAFEAILKIKAFPLPNKQMIKLFDKRTHANLSQLLPIFEKRLRDFLSGTIQVDHDDYLEMLDAVDA
jgi:predicted protein tyrosine phosphatase